MVEGRERIHKSGLWYFTSGALSRFFFSSRLRSCFTVDRSSLWCSSSLIIESSARNKSVALCVFEKVENSGLKIAPLK